MTAEPTSERMTWAFFHYGAPVRKAALTPPLIPTCPCCGCPPPAGCSDRDCELKAEFDIVCDDSTIYVGCFCETHAAEVVASLNSPVDDETAAIIRESRERRPTETATYDGDVPF